MPQLSGSLFLADGGIETDLIFNRGIEIPEFAAHTLLAHARGRAAVSEYFRNFLELARAHHTGFVLDSQTWKAHRHWAGALGASTEDLRRANRDSVALIAGLRDEYAGRCGPIVLNGIIGPVGDAYAVDHEIGADEAEDYHSEQIEWLAATEIDMVTATTFGRAAEAVGFVRAALGAGLPVVVSFTVETDGRLPNGQPLAEAIDSVDSETGSGPTYFMINCAHPDHFARTLAAEPWARRIRGLRCNASRLSHAELDACEVLDHGNPVELAGQYLEIRSLMPWVNVLGGCCGTDLRHIGEIARAAAG